MPHLVTLIRVTLIRVALIRADPDPVEATFIDGELAERPGGGTRPEAAQTILTRRFWQVPRVGWLVGKHRQLGPATIRS